MRGDQRRHVGSERRERDVRLKQGEGDEKKKKNWTATSMIDESSK